MLRSTCLSTFVRNERIMALQHELPSTDLAQRPDLQLVPTPHIPLSAPWFIRAEANRIVETFFEEADAGITRTPAPIPPSKAIRDQAESIVDGIFGNEQSQSEPIKLPLGYIVHLRADKAQPTSSQQFQFPED